VSRIFSSHGWHDLNEAYGPIGADHDNFDNEAQQTAIG